MITVVRVSGQLPHTLKMRGDRHSLETLLPDSRPLFIHTGRNGNDLVRIALPAGLFPGVEDVVCPCCGGKVLTNPDGSISLDVALDDIDFYVEEVPVTSG